MRESSHRREWSHWIFSGQTDLQIGAANEQLNPAEADANARLIAASPDLLTSLKAMVDQFWGDGEFDEWSRTNYRNYHPAHPVVVAETTIAKAEGRVL